MKKKRDISGLTNILYDEDYDLRSTAAEALGQIGDAESVTPLIEALKDRNRLMLWPAAKALTAIGKPSVGSLLTCINDKNKVMRKAVIRSLGLIGDKKAIEQIAAALYDVDTNVVNEAVVALSNMGDERGEKFLKEQKKKQKLKEQEYKLKLKEQEEKWKLKKQKDKMSKKVKYFLILKKGAKPTNELWYVDQVIQNTYPEVLKSPGVNIQFSSDISGSIDQDYILAFAAEIFGQDILKEGTYNIHTKDFRDASGDSGMVLIAYKAKLKEQNIKNSKIKRGGFNEPYCSEKCYNEAGRKISSLLLAGSSGQCGFCQTPVNLGLGSNIVAFPYRGMVLHICKNCRNKGEKYVQEIDECCMCANELR